MLEKIALPTPFSDAPITTMDLGARKLFFNWVALMEVDDEDNEGDAENEDGDGDEEPVVEEVDKAIEKVISRTDKCVYTIDYYYLYRTNIVI